MSRRAMGKLLRIMYQDSEINHHQRSPNDTQAPHEHRFNTFECIGSMMLMFNLYTVQRTYKV